MVIYNSFITSNLSYCPLAWHFSRATVGTDKFGKKYKRALRFITNNHTSSLTEMLTQTNTEHLHVKRLRLMAWEVFKIINKLFLEYINDQRELVTLLNLSSWCLVMVERLFLAGPRGCLRLVIVVFPDHTHLLFIKYFKNFIL